MNADSISRRGILQGGAAAVGLAVGSRAGTVAKGDWLHQFGYGQIQLTEGPHKRQFAENQQLLLNLSEDSLLRPFRLREGLPAPGSELGGWYDTYGFAPAATYGQWLSALARGYAATGDPAVREKVNRLVRGYAATISPEGRFYVENRFPSYIYDKLVCGLMEAHTFAGDRAAVATLARATAAASKHLPARAIARQETPMLGRDDFTRHCWDESYTMPENLFLAAVSTGDPLYRGMAQRFLFNDEFFFPLAREENVLPGRHAYSHVNALSSAAQAYLVLGDDRYLRAARNGFGMVEQQSYATGGWGPDEHFFIPGSGKLGESLRATHSSFETPCGAYAHFKITRYLLAITRDSHYGDSMERVMYNTVLGARPIQPDGSSFYYSDYNFEGKKVAHPDKWPCCSGTLPQISADYGISAYLYDRSGVYVNLYIPSVLTWAQGGAKYSLRQTTAYPYESRIQLDLTASAPGVFSVFLRIPEWAAGAAVSVSGSRGSQKVKAGAFAELHREWKNGDRIELELPLATRLEPVDAQHPDTVALLAGPLVLFGTGEDAGWKLSRRELGALRRGAAGSRVKAFQEIGDERYTTYFQVF